MNENKELEKPMLICYEAEMSIVTECPKCLHSFRDVDGLWCDINAYGYGEHCPHFDGRSPKIRDVERLIKLGEEMIERYPDDWVLKMCVLNIKDHRDELGKDENHD